eukprot:8195299-Pyramimonas_sp.AAC.1
MPAPFFRGSNYPSYDEFLERAARDFEEMLERGVLEGPLRFVKGYPADLCAPHTSNNYREFDTGLEGML